MLCVSSQIITTSNSLISNLVSLPITILSAEDNDDDFERVLEMQKSLIDQKQAQNFCIIFGADNIEDKIQGFLRQFPVDLIVVDCFTDVYGKDINDNSAIRRFYNEFDKIINVYGHEQSVVVDKQAKLT